jgi:hypothetical protein
MMKLEYLEIWPRTMCTDECDRKEGLPSRTDEADRLGRHNCILLTGSVPMKWHESFDTSGMLAAG